MKAIYKVVLIGIGIAGLAVAKADNSDQPWILAGNLFQYNPNYMVTIQVEYQACDRNFGCEPNINKADINEQSYSKIYYGWYGQGGDVDRIKIIQATVYDDGTPWYTVTFGNNCKAFPGQKIYFLPVTYSPYIAQTIACRVATL